MVRAKWGNGFCGSERVIVRMEGRVVGGILGVVTGDALGLPVQFMTRAEVKKRPVSGMQGGGFLALPPGTWSDDSSLTLCLAESLVDKGYDLKDMSDRFVRWYREGYWTPFGQAFDIGNATRQAMQRLMKGVKPLEAGPAGEDNNGNGSLMRILPAALYFAHLPEPELIPKMCEVSRITHGHARSLLGCSLYAFLVKGLLAGESPAEAYHHMREKALKLEEHSGLGQELRSYSRLLGGSLAELGEDEIRSSGYVVDTLEAALWSLLTSRDFKETVLKAVNLGLDTDSVGAVAGGLAGVCYGFAGIPEEWLSQLIKYNEIFTLSRQFVTTIADHPHLQWTEKPSHL